MHPTLFWQAGAFALGVAAQPLLQIVENAMARKRSLDIEPMALWIKMMLAGLCGVLFWLALQKSTSVGQWLCLLCAICLCWQAALFDAKYRRIPNSTVLGLLAVGALSCFAGYTNAGFFSCVAGFLLSGALFIVPFAFGKNIGAGDVKLAAAIGFCTGLVGSLNVIVIMGLLILFFSMARRGNFWAAMHSNIPMGPFVATAFLLFTIT